MFYFQSNDNVTVYFSDGGYAVWPKEHSQFQKVIQFCKDSNWIALETMHNASKAILTSKAIINEDDSITIENKSGVCTIPSDSTTLTSFIKLLKDKGVIQSEIDRIRPFLENMVKNPFINAVTELYDYCKAMDFEITEDGCFLAYKNVNKDLSSIYDNGQTKHAIGEYTSVEAFDTDREQVCSKGLHFCSRKYLQSYKGDVTIVVKVNPMDVVAIPKDYQFLKGRCKRYLTIGVIEPDGTLADVYDAANYQAKVVKKYNEDMEAYAKEHLPERTYNVWKNRVQLGHTITETVLATRMSPGAIRKHTRRYKRIMKWGGFDASRSQVEEAGTGTTDE